MHTVSTVKVLLSAGADPTLAQKDGDRPFDVAKTPEIRDLIAGQDLEETLRLIEARKVEMRKALESRLSNAAEREQLARQLIREELVAMARCVCIVCVCVCARSRALSRTRSVNPINSLGTPSLIPTSYH